MRTGFQKRSRKGLAVPEFLAVVGGVAVVIILAVTQLGGAANTELQKTSEDMLNPAELAKKYGPKGNNGFGNGGGDGSPNGFQDETR